MSSWFAPAKTPAETAVDMTPTAPPRGPPPAVVEAPVLGEPKAPSVVAPEYKSPAVGTTPPAAPPAGPAPVAVAPAPYAPAPATPYAPAPATSPYPPNRYAGGERYSKVTIYKIIGFLLRPILLTFSLIAWSVVANTTVAGKKWSKIHSLEYILAMNVFASAWAIFTMVEFIIGFCFKGELPHFLQYIMFFGDLILSYLLLSAASTGAGLTSDVLYGQSCSKNYCTRMRVATAFTFMAFIVLLPSLALSEISAMRTWFTPHSQHNVGRNPTRPTTVAV